MDHHNYRRDSFSSGLINTDQAALDAYRAQREKMRSMERDINSIKEQLSEIMTLLQTITRG